MGGHAVVRYFRCSLEVYGVVCQSLDSAYGYPNAQTKTLRSLPPSDEIPSDAQGRVYLAVSQDYCEYVLPSQMIPQLLESGAADEIAAGEYEAAFAEWRGA